MGPSSHSTPLLHILGGGNFLLCPTVVQQGQRNIAAAMPAWKGEFKGTKGMGKRPRGDWMERKKSFAPGHFFSCTLFFRVCMENSLNSEYSTTFLCSSSPVVRTPVPLVELLLDVFPPRRPLVPVHGRDLVRRPPAAGEVLVGAGRQGDAHVRRLLVLVVGRQIWRKNTQFLFPASTLETPCRFAFSPDDCCSPTLEALLLGGAPAPPTPPPPPPAPPPPPPPPSRSDCREPQREAVRCSVLAIPRWAVSAC